MEISADKKGGSVVNDYCYFATQNNTVIMHKPINRAEKGELFIIIIIYYYFTTKMGVMQQNRRTLKLAT